MRISILLFAFFLVDCQSGKKEKHLENTPKKEFIVSRIKADRLLDSQFIIHELQFLASDTCEGRKPGSKGHEAAVQRILHD